MAVVPASSVGASLLAIAAIHPTLMLTEDAPNFPSRAAVIHLSLDGSQAVRLVEIK